MLLTSFKKNIRKRKNKKLFPSSRIHHTCKYNDDTCFSGYNIVNKNVNLCSSKIGVGTFFGTDVNMCNCNIGNFCSIGSNISVIDATHPLTLVSTFPSFFKTANNTPFGKGDYCFKEFIHCDNGFAINIGNDVWVGDNVILKGGICIGDGAVIGMGSVVTKDVSPYAIVGGNPAHLIRFRFNNNVIENLLLIKWWDWDVDTIFKNRNDFIDVDAFINKYKNKNK